MQSGAGAVVTKYKREKRREGVSSRQGYKSFCY